MLDTIKRIMGLKKSRRPALNLEKLQAPVEASRLKLETAQAEHAATLEQAIAHAKELADAMAAFDANGGSSNADRVIAARRETKRHSMFTERTQRLVDRAAAAYQEAQATHDRAVLETLDKIFDGAGAHISAEWLSTGLPAVRQLVAFLDEIDQIAREAESAGREASHIRGDENAWLKARHLDALRGSVRALIRDAAPNHIDRL